MKNDSIDKRQLLLATATTIFSLNGFAGTRVDEIAKESKVNKNMIYYYFGNKEALYKKVLENQIQELFQSIQKSEGNTEWDIIENAAKLYFDYCYNNREYVSLMQWEMVSEWKTLNQLTIETENQSKNYLIETIEKGIQKGLFHSKTNPRLFMSLSIVQIFCFFPLLKHPNLLHNDSNNPIQEHEFLEYKEQLVDQVMRSLRPDN